MTNVRLEKLRIIYRYKSIVEYVDLWIALCSVLTEEGLLSEKYKIVDKLRTINQIEKALDKGESFIIEDENFSFSLGSIGGNKIQQLIINQEKKVKVNWDLWIKGLSNLGVFVYAWQMDREFFFWQNEEDLESYTSRKKPYEHLPTKESGDPLPLPQIIIDTSKNPGRNIFKIGYVEAVGSTMWLGDEFFSLTGASKEAVKSTDWLDVKELKPDILKIKAQEDCFTQFEGKEADLQNKMRDLLYPGHD